MCHMQLSVKESHTFTLPLFLSFSLCLSFLLPTLSTLLSTHFLSTPSLSFLWIIIDQTVNCVGCALNRVASSNITNTQGSGILHDLSS